ILRTCRLKRDFFFYSRRRLQLIAEQVNARALKRARLDCFHGFTPWVSTEPPRAYISWSECPFPDYINIYHRRERVRPSDLERIERAEADWLSRAQRVAFSSRWAAKRCVEHYGLNESLVRFIGIFGEVASPKSDEYQGGKQFVFVSTDFEAKGGPFA